MKMPMNQTAREANNYATIPVECMQKLHQLLRCQFNILILHPHTGHDSYWRNGASI
jgi:hypothetical protein